jgi:ADP-ribose pyrophosphatase
VTEPEKTISSELVYEGSRITVRRDVVSLPDGSTAQRDIVEHPNAVSIVAVDSDNNVVLVRQYRRAPKLFLLEVPAGVMDPSEEPVEAAQRELREETGLAADKLDFLGDFYNAPGILTERMYAFLATGLTEDALPPDEDEDIEVERVPLAKAMEMARSGDLNDAKSIVSLLMAERRLTSWAVR